ncbi:MAG TPA: FecR domain-containing protein [Chitinophagaceae bacterium]|nr:FecR domain-containing protein [Chitinophagaceae bacterium]
MMQTDRLWTLLGRKLAGEASPEELAELEDLLKVHPEAHLSIQAVTETWDEPLPAEDQEATQAYERLAHRLKDLGFGFREEEGPQELYLPATRPLRRRNKVVLVGVLAITVLAVAIWWVSPARSSADRSGREASAVKSSVSTRYGSRSRVDLPDGSVVWLNAGSTLTYDPQFGVTNREVRLSGEGYFKVVHNENKPFLIHTSVMDIRDLGTQFNVKCYPDDRTTETSLVEGSVEITVRRRGERYTLKPNQKLVLLNEAIGADSGRAAPGKAPSKDDEPIMAIRSLTYKADDTVAVETAWAYNRLSFADERFSEVTKKLSRWFNREFAFSNHSLEDERLTGSFPPQTTLEQAMEALKYGYRFNYEIRGEKVIIY